MSTEWQTNAADWPRHRSESVETLEGPVGTCVKTVIVRKTVCSLCALQEGCSRIRTNWY